jgi:hypothetical protein
MVVAQVDRPVEWNDQEVEWNDPEGGWNGPLRTVRWGEPTQDATTNAPVRDSQQQDAYMSHCFDRRVHRTLAIVERHLAAYVS